VEDSAVHARRPSLISRIAQALVASVVAAVVIVGYAYVGLSFGSASPGFVAGWTCLAIVVGFIFGSWVAVVAPPGLIGLFLLLFLARGRGTAGELFDANFVVWSAGVSVPMGIGVWLRQRFDRLPTEGGDLLGRWASGR
jgi:hypothetical protein